MRLRPSGPLRRAVSKLDGEEIRAGRMPVPSIAVAREEPAAVFVCVKGGEEPPWTTDRVDALLIGPKRGETRM